MEITPDEIASFIDRPSEGLNREIKRWIDPNTASGVEKIVKACFALRNRNGGYLLVGFDNSSLLPNLDAHWIVYVQKVFHPDAIQGIISKYASEPFEIAVGFGYRDGHQFPVVKIAEGVRSPVAVRRSLDNGSGGLLLREGDVYFRTLNTNGSFSSAKATWKDWSDIVETCFENREADIGRFLRRHLTGKEAGALIELITRVAPRKAATSSLRERANDLLTQGEKGFRESLDERSLSDEEKSALKRGMWQIALVVEPPRASALPDQEFLTAALGSNPQLTGWPIWLDSRGFSDRSARPRVKNNTWEALIISLSDISNHIDFWTLDPKGKFYLQRVLQDDLTNKVAPGKELDIILVVIRVAEAIAVALSLVKALGWTEDARLGIAFRWTGLSGRKLSSWANPWATVGGKQTSHTDSVRTFVDIPANTPLSAIAPYVDDATRNLFVVFDGYRIQSQVIEHWTQRAVERRL